MAVKKMIFRIQKQTRCLKLAPNNQLMLQAQIKMTEQCQGYESPAEIIPPLPVYESSQYSSRGVNLNELIKLHRNRQKYEIVDRFFNNSYISIENKLQPIEIYYQCEMFKSFIDDLALVYFKDIEFNETVRLEFVLRRLNFTLNGEVYDFKQFLEENKFYDDVRALFSEQYLQDLTNEGNEKSVLNLRNSLMLAFIIDVIYTYDFSSEQRQNALREIDELYRHIAESLNEEDFTISNASIIDNGSESFIKSEQCESESLEKKSENYSLSNSYNNAAFTVNKHSFDFDDILYQEEINLKIIQIELQTNYLLNQLNDPQIDETIKPNHRYIIQINKEMIEKLNELREKNISNRQIVKKIQRNIKIELSTGVRCICFNDSSDISQCFGFIKKIDSVVQQNQQKLQKIVDVEYMENQLLKMIQKLKYRMIADAIEKVFDIQKDDTKKSTDLLFSVSFEHGIGVKQAVLNESDFLMLNQIREESTLTSYLTPMKSTYSYISHNIYTFLKLSQKDFPYNKQTNNNEEVMKSIKAKIGKMKNFTKNDKKAFYQQQFKLCHNCKILCHQDFLKQCRKRAKQIRQQDSDCSDDSLYTEKNFRRKNQSPYFIECQKYYCLYCIKFQFNGKIFNDKGWCPACLSICHCNTCLRQKILKKYVELYLFIGGDKDNIKTQMEMINEMRVKQAADNQCNDQSNESGTQIDDKVYESVIKKEIMKGYSADEIGQSLRYQQELIQMIIKREKVKFRHLGIEKALFREKIKFLTDEFQYEHIDLEMQNKRMKIQMEQQKQKEEELQRLKKLKQKKIIEKGSVKRKSRSVRRDEEIYFDFYRYNDDDSELQSSSFHLKHKRQREKFYEPQYNF